MLVDNFPVWMHEISLWLQEIFKYIFPEYPKIGIAVAITALIFFLYYLARGQVRVAFKMTATSIVFFVVLLFSLHWLIKIYRVVF